MISLYKRLADVTTISSGHQEARKPFHQARLLSAAIFRRLETEKALLEVLDENNPNDRSDIQEAGNRKGIGPRKLICKLSVRSLSDKLLKTRGRVGIRVELMRLIEADQIGLSQSYRFNPYSILANWMEYGLRNDTTDQDGF